MIVLLIFLITWFIIRLLKVVLDQVAAGRLQILGLHPETVGATRKLYRRGYLALCALRRLSFLAQGKLSGLQGISVFFGLMLTLGSAG